MFDEFKYSQKLAYDLLINSVYKNKISHAYLIDGNSNEFGYDFVLSFVKMLICDYNYTNMKKCGSCVKCKRFDEGNYTEVKIIDSDGLVIKKEQLLELQNDFSRSAIEGNKRIYIIKDCDKMNKYASNTLLKFLEEPSDGIVAVLYTNNLYKVLPTIVSRCQLIRLKNDNNIVVDKTIINFANFCCNSKVEINDFINDSFNSEMIDAVLSFLNYFEENGLDIVIYIKKMWYNIFSERESNILGLILIINLYYDVFKYYYNVNNYFFVDFSNEIKKIANLNNASIIIEKINLCMESLECLKVNLNVNLVMDNLLIKLEECKV